MHTLTQRTQKAFAHLVPCSCNYTVTFSVWYNATKQQHEHLAHAHLETKEVLRPLSVSEAMMHRLTFISFIS